MKKIYFFVIILLNWVHVFAYDFSAVCSSGQTLYYTIINADSNFVQLTAPAKNYEGFEKPTGIVYVPKYVNHNNVVYTVTSIYNAFPDCSGISIHLPNIELGAHVLSEAGSISEVHSGIYNYNSPAMIDSLFIDDSTTSIAGAAFANSSIDYLYIGNSILTIGPIFISGFTNHVGYGHGTAIYQEYADGYAWTIEFNAKNCMEMTYHNSQISCLVSWCRTLIIGDSVRTLPFNAFSCHDRRGTNLLTLRYNAKNCENFMYSQLFRCYHAQYSYASDLPDNCTVTSSFVKINIENLSIGEEVQFIPANAFADVSSIRGTLKLPKMTFVGSGAFYQTGIDTLLIGDSNDIVTNTPIAIDSIVFKNCYNLKFVFLGRAIDTIGEQAFANCNSLRHIEIPNQLVVIKDAAFSNCNNLLKFPTQNILNHIGACAFDNCTLLDSLYLSNTISSIGKYAFRNCQNLSLYNPLLPNNLITINDGTFQNCIQLGALEFPNSIKKIGENAFYGCTNLYFNDLPDSVKIIGNNAFKNCFHLSGALIIPNTTDSLGQESFSNTAIDTLIIGDNVRYVNKSFQNCNQLKYCHIGKSIESIFGGFDGDNSISTVSFAARNCTTFFSINSSTLDTVSVFNDSKNSVQIIIFGDSVKYIPRKIFCDFQHIVSPIQLPNTLLSIGNLAFSNCINIPGTILIPGLCKSIGSNAFTNCDNILSIDIDNASVTLGDSAFISCDRLVNVNLGDSAISIGNSAFKDCFRLNNVQMGNLVTRIGNSAFEGCVRLPFPRLSNALASIGDNAFKGCNLFSGEITIPAEVDTIGDYAFSGCSGVTALNMKPLNPPIIYEHTFDSISNNIPVYVPCGRVLNYYVTDYWENFPNILEAQPFEVEVSSNNNAMGTATVTSAPTCSNHEAIIAATANEGFHFHSWNDGNQLNPRVIAVEQDTSFTAIFAVNQINAVINSSDISMGTATGSGVYSYNNVITATAIPNNNYHFLRWNDGNTQNPRYIPATEDITLTAIFVSNVSTITVTSNNSDMGTAIGSGLYFYQQQISIMANPNYGYHFVAWNDGNTQNPRQLIVNCDTSFVATFAPNIYAVSINSLNNVMGYTSGSGNYTYNSQMSFSATPNTGYHFTQWNDGISQNPRTLTVTQDTSFTAQFAANSYAVTVTANDPVMGSAFGAGSFTYNTQTVISATANYGYHFVQWSDGVTDNPRMITVTNSAEYEAQFAINFYTITVGSNNPAIGTASGGGTYNYNSIINLVATPNYGYHFTQWSDGNTDNPRAVTVIRNASYTAQFAINSYAVTVSGNDPAMGTVSGTGSYIYNNTATISASPYYGYHFTQWNDGNTENPRTFVVTQDATYTAQFDYNTYTISTYSNDITIGYVTGGGAYNYNSIVALTAVPSEHYHFVQWNDSISDNPRNIIVKKDSVYTAYFAIDQHQIMVNSANTMMGTAEGSGLYNYGSNVYISAIPNYGYHFTQWSDGNAQNPRHVSVSGDTAFTALFEINNYTLTVLNGDTTMGNVSNSGTYNYLTQVTISATPVYGYHFVQWTDGNTDNPRTVTLTQDTVFTAQFAINTYFVNLTANDSTLGTVSGSGEYAYQTQVVISATANENCHFVQWSDGSTSNPRQITLTNDVILTAQFEENEKFLIQVLSSDDIMGTTSGSGEYYVGTQISISAIAYEHYHFVQWSDGVTSNPRSVTVIENATYTALFEPETYTITATSSNDAMGTVTGGGSYAYGTIVELRANANNGYHFVCWNDGDSSSIRSIIVEGDAEYTATFSEGVSIANHQKVEVSVYPNPTSGILHITAEDIQKIEIYDLQGRLVMLSRKESTLNLNQLTNGIYTISVYSTNGISEKKVVKVEK